MGSVQLRIRDLIRDSGLSMEAFSRKIGTHQSSLSRALSQNKNIGDAMINKIVIAFNINKEWLLTGEGPMLKPSSQPEPPAVSAAAPDDVARLLGIIESQQRVIESQAQAIKILSEK